MVFLMISNMQNKMPAHIQSGILLDMDCIFLSQWFLLISSQSIKLQKQILFSSAMWISYTIVSSYPIKNKLFKKKKANGKQQNHSKCRELILPDLHLVSYIIQNIYRLSYAYSIITFLSFSVLHWWRVWFLYLNWLSINQKKI